MLTLSMAVPAIRNMVVLGMVAPNMVVLGMVAPNMVVLGMVAPAIRNMVAPGMAVPGMVAPNMVVPGMVAPNMVVLDTATKTIRAISAGRPVVLLDMTGREGGNPGTRFLGVLGR